jgi:PIN domain nuclease of toxin-antitoxin system
MIVLDTSALIFWTLDPQRLSPKAKQAIEQADRILISSISIWEIALKVKRQKLVIPLPINEYVDRLHQLGSLEILAVDIQTWLDNVDLPWDHRDPADRTVVALAARNNCPLITSDEMIANFFAKTIW